MSLRSDSDSLLPAGDSRCMFSERLRRFMSPPDFADSSKRHSKGNGAFVEDYLSSADGSTFDAVARCYASCRMVNVPNADEPVNKREGREHKDTNST